MPSVSSSSSHPPTVVGKIVGWNADNKTVEKAVLAAVRDRLPTVLAGLMASYLPKQEGIFDENDWNELCGKVKPAPPLPEDMEKIWEGLCHVVPGQKVKRSHILVYLPATVNDKPLTLKTLGEIVKQRHFKASQIGYRYIWDEIMKKIGNQSVDKAGWVLMTKTVIDGSRRKSYKAQKNMIQELAKNTKIPYTMPSVKEAVFCILIHHMRTGECLFSNNPSTYTRCQEIIDDKPVVVGGFSLEGLEVDCNYEGYDSLGVAAMLKC